MATDAATDIIAEWLWESMGVGPSWKAVPEETRQFHRARARQLMNRLAIKGHPLRAVS